MRHNYIFYYDSVCVFSFSEKYMLCSAYCVMVSNCAAAIGAYVFCAQLRLRTFYFFRKKFDHISSEKRRQP